MCILEFFREIFFRETVSELFGKFVGIVASEKGLGGIIYIGNY